MLWCCGMDWFFLRRAAAAVIRLIQRFLSLLLYIIIFFYILVSVRSDHTHMFPERYTYMERHFVNESALFHMGDINFFLLDSFLQNMLVTKFRFQFGMPILLSFSFQC